jgi:alpha-ketoglutarate-dependent taurine dioxygenase
VFHLDRGDLVARYNDALIASAEGLSGTPLDTEGREALAAMRAIADSPELWVEFPIEKGQIQYLNNRHFAHSRTAFQDAPEPHLRRHLIRLWNRDEGRQTFHGYG